MNKNYLLRRIEKIEEDGVAPPNATTLAKFDEQAGELYWDGAPVIGSVGDVEIADVTGLQAELDDKAPLSHTHTIADVQNLSVELNDKSDVGHTHTMSEVGGLETALLGKASVEDLHSHANKALLDALTDENGELQYNDSPIGTTTLTGLTDTPTGYGTEGQVLAVNSTGSAVEWVTPEAGGEGTGGGASTFTDLSDTPVDYTGSGGKVVSVKADESGLEYVEAPSGGGGGGEETIYGTFTPTERYGVLNNISDQRGFYWKQGDFITIQIFLKWRGSSGDKSLYIQGLPELPLESYTNLFVGTNGEVLPYNSSGEVGQVWYAEVRSTRDRIYIHAADRSAAQTSNYSSGRYIGVFLQGTYKFK